MTNSILQECAVFAAACMNDKKNGTLYFGISPDESRGRKKGEIVGVQLWLSLEVLDQNIPFMFFPDKYSQTLVKSCVRNLKIVPVDRKQKGQTLFVIELDVAGVLSKNTDYIKVNAKEIPSFSKQMKTNDPIFTFESGKPRKLTHELSGFSQIPANVLEQQNNEHKDVHRARPSLLSLQNHLTGGLDKMDDELFIFLLLGPICGSQVDVDSMEFIKKLQPVVVFDFDPSNESSNGIYNSLDEKEEVMRVVTLNDFDERQKDQKEYKAFQNELTMCDFTNWVFCNGYGQMEEMESTDWNKKRGRAFQAAFTHYIERCHQDRVLIIICLPSAEYNVILDPCDVILRQFPDQWILLSETQSVAEYWQETFKKRDKVNAKDLKDRCVIGLSWKQINNGVTSWCGKKNSNECMIPDSSGCQIKVEIKKINEWKNDVEVLSSLDPIDVNEDEETVTALKKRAEEEFYRGGQVSWLNFFSDHVCRRKIHGSLLKLVEDALEGKQSEDDEKILTTYLFHEPGAGGSTLVRHILWSLRERYRCCIVRDTNNPNQTADMLTEIFLFRDQSPKPLLVLLDNEDEDKVYQLRVCLEKRARSYGEHYSDIFCVLLICSRMVGVPPVNKRKCSMVTLEQLLDPVDNAWFQERYKDLTSRYANPKSLISFNILKENFNKDFLKNTVKEFLDEIKDPKEQEILKIVSFINNYDLDFKFIHASCFDTILESPSVFRSASSGKRKTCWEANVSQSLKVFLNLSSLYDIKSVKKIRLFTKLTAEHILDCLRERSGESVSDILDKLLTDKIFCAVGQEMKKFQNIISNIVKKRALKKNVVGNERAPSFRKEKFSPLVLHIIEYESSDVAGCIMETLFELNLDPFTAQQVARFYIEHKNYKKAEKYAEKATILLPWNSYMWDTYANVFKYQLNDKFKSQCQIVDGKFSPSDLKEIISLSQTCTYYFRKEQSVSEKEALTSNAEINRAGYFGELRSILFVLSSLEKCSCFESKKIVHTFLVDQTYTNSQLSFLSEEETRFLKKLWSYSKDTVNKLGDAFLQTKVEIEANPLSSSLEESRITLLQLHVSLNEYFGESSETIPAYIHEDEKSLYRSRLLFSKKCSSLFNALQLKHNKDFDLLNYCYGLILENVKSLNSTVEDIKILLDIVTALMTETKRRLPFGLKFDAVIDWSKDFYKRALRENYGHLESFLYFCLYNFPTKERLMFPNLASSCDFDTVTKNWKEFFNATKNLERIAHRETTLFFLGNGKPPQDIVYQKYLNKLMQGKEFEKKWQSPEVCHQLRLMSGILSENGDFVDYDYTSKQGNRNWIKIKTTNRIKKRAWLQKRVYFFLGFSFSGLKAYGMSDTDPMTQNPLPSGALKISSGGPTKLKPKQKQSVRSLRELQDRKTEITAHIKRKKRERKPFQDLERELQAIDNDIEKILGV